MELPEYNLTTLAALDPETLVALLASDEDRAPREVIDECASRGDAMLGGLSRRRFADDEIWWLGDAREDEWWLRLHGAMILGLMSSARAGHLLAEWLRRIAEAEDDNLQDWLAGYWPALFRNKPDSTRASVRAVAEDPSLDWYHRCGAVEAALAMAEARSDKALDDEIDWAASIAKSPSEDWDLRLMTAITLLDYPRERHRAWLVDLVGQQPADDRMFDLGEVESAFESPGLMRDSDRFRDPWKFYSPAAIAARQLRWAKEDEESRCAAATWRGLGQHGVGRRVPSRAGARRGRSRPGMTRARAAVWKKYSSQVLVLGAELLALPRRYRPGGRRGHGAPAARERRKRDRIAAGWRHTTVQIGPAWITFYDALIAAALRA